MLLGPRGDASAQMWNSVQESEQSATEHSRSFLISDSFLCLFLVLFHLFFFFFSFKCPQLQVTCSTKKKMGMISLLQIRYRCLAIQPNKQEHWWRPACIPHPATPRCACTLTSPPPGLVLQLSPPAFQLESTPERNIFPRTTKATHGRGSPKPPTGPSLTPLHLRLG